MATIQRAWKGWAKCFTCDASSGGKGDISLGAMQYEGAHIQVKWDVSGGNTASLTTKVFGSEDATEIDTLPLFQYDITPVVSSTNRASFVIKDLYYFEISCKVYTTGADVSGGDISVSYDAWCWSSA